MKTTYTYRVITGNSASELQESIIGFLNQGWKLVGGVSVTPNRDETATTPYLFAQAIGIKQETV